MTELQTGKYHAVFDWFFLKTNKCTTEYKVKKKYFVDVHVFFDAVGLKPVRNQFPTTSLHLVCLGSINRQGSLKRLSPFSIWSFLMEPL